ncbi:MAG: hypothetical protein M0007_00295, partial [Actinomycetota bacterium]|nr:hypothetical protein [Actinomycetota bacterium]
QQYAQPPMAPQQYAQPPMAPQQYAQPPMPPQQYAQPGMSPQQYAQPGMSPQQYAQPGMPPQQYAQPPMPPQQYAQPPMPPQQYAQPGMPPQQYAPAGDPLAGFGQAVEQAAAPSPPAAPRWRRRSAEEVLAEQRSHPAVALVRRYVGLVVFLVVAGLLIAFVPSARHSPSGLAPQVGVTAPAPAGSTAPPSA